MDFPNPMVDFVFDTLVSHLSSFFPAQPDSNNRQVAIAWEMCVLRIICIVMEIENNVCRSTPSFLRKKFRFP